MLAARVAPAAPAVVCKNSRRENRLFFMDQISEKHCIRTDKRTASFLAMATLAILLPPHRQVNILAAPFPGAARRHLRRFHQQETQQSVPCFVICPSRRRFPLESSNGTSPK